MSADRCPAAHVDDPTSCDGESVVRIVDQMGEGLSGCVHHGARLYASLERPRVYPLAGQDGAAIEVYQLAQVVPPFAWMRDTAA